MVLYKIIQRCKGQRVKERSDNVHIDQGWLDVGAAI